MVRTFREQVGLSGTEAAERLYTSESTITRVERGIVAVNVHMLKSMLDLYEIGADRWDPLIDMCLDAGEKGWWHEFGPGIDGMYIGLETEVEELFAFGLSVIHGLLQTTGYARALIKKGFEKRKGRGTNALVDRQVALRMARQERLNGEDPLKLTVILDEMALVRPIGGRQVMKEQLLHLVRLATLPNITILVLPFDAESHLGLEGAFSILRFPRDTGEPDLVYHQYPFNELFLEKADQLSMFRELFGDLRAVALSPEDSVALIQRRADEL
jgi:transcriptional regulator with XRE-family HTH domain